MINIILLYSNRPSIGKTTFATKLKKELENTKLLSFASPIKKISYNFYIDVFKSINSISVFPIDFNSFKQDLKDIPLLSSQLTPRDITVSISELVQDIYGPEIWAQLAYESCQTFNKIVNTEIFIFDDWRRPIENSYFETKEDINLIKVYISKQERRIIERLSDTSESYEGLIKSDQCDIVFEFNEDWSNSKELIELIKNKLRKSNA